MLSNSPTAARLACTLFLAVAPAFTPSSVTANDSLLAPPRLRLPGEAGAGGIAIDLPPFLQPIATDFPVQDAQPQAAGLLPQQSWKGDARTPHATHKGRSHTSPLTDAEREFAQLERWRKGVFRLTVVLLACAAIASFAVLVSLAQRR